MKRELADLNVFANTTLQHYELPELFRLTSLINIASKSSIEWLNVMPGGLTNKNFKATLQSGKNIAVRVAGKGTATYLNRPAEKHNANLMALIGIAPEIYYYDTSTGSQLVEFIDARTMHAIDFQEDREVLKKAATVMSKYHNSGLEFISNFNPLEKIETYLQIIEEYKFKEMYAEFNEVKTNLDLLAMAYKNNPPRLTPCHNDTLPENFMYDGKTMRVIDWEYGGMNDPYFDLGCVIVENPLSKATENDFVEAYFGAKPTEEQYARVQLNKFLVNAHWALWSIVQICYGKDHDFYWEYGQYRMTYCKKILADKDFDNYLKIIS